MDLLSGEDFFSEASQGNARSRLERSNVQRFFYARVCLEKLTTQTLSRIYTKMFFFLHKWSLDHEFNKEYSEAVISITFYLVEASFSGRPDQDV